MQGLSGKKFSFKQQAANRPGDVGDAAPPQGAAARSAVVQTPLSPRATEQAVGPVPLEDPVGPEHALQTNRERAFFEAEISRLSGLVAQVDEFLAGGETGSTLSMVSGQCSSLRDDSAGLLQRWQVMLQALDAREARDAALHEQKSPSAMPDPKEQRKLEKKARRALKPPLLAEHRVREAEISMRPEVTALTDFIVSHFERRLLPLTDDAWRAIANWAGFSDLPKDAQQVARDFAELTADQRNSSDTMVRVHDQRHQAPGAAARRGKAEQKDPPHMQSDASRAARQREPQAVETRPVRVHLPEPAAAQEPVLPAPEQQALTPLQRFLKQTVARPNEAKVLAQFIASNIEKPVLKGVNKNTDVASIRHWPGFDQMDRNVKRLGETYASMSYGDRADTDFNWQIVELLRRPDDAPPLPAQLPTPAAALSARLGPAYREYQIIGSNVARLLNDSRLHDATFGPAAAAAAQKVFAGMMPADGVIPLPALKNFPRFRELPASQQKAVEMRFDLCVAQRVLEATQAELNDILRELPAQELVLADMDLAFTAQLASNRAAATALKDFLHADPVPDVARGERHTNLPGFTALPVEVRELLAQADNLMAQAHLCGRLAHIASMRDGSRPKVPTLTPTPVKHAKPGAKLTRTERIRQVVLNVEVERENVGATAMAVQLQEQKHPEALAALRALQMAQPLSASEIRYASLKGFEKMHAPTKLLGHARDASVEANRRLEHVLTTAQMVLLNLFESSKPGE